MTAPIEMINPNNLPFSALFNLDGSVEVVVKHAANGVYKRLKTIKSDSAGFNASKGIIFLVFGPITWAFYNSKTPGTMT
jgi:hypothetical protein